MSRLSIRLATDPGPRVRVRIVNVKVKARRWAAAAIALGAAAVLMLAVLFSQRIASAGLWVAAVVLLPVACAAISIFFYKTEEPQPRRIFN